MASRIQSSKIGLFANNFLDKINGNSQDFKDLLTNFDGVKAWNELLDLPLGKAWVRNNIKILERMSGLTTVGQRTKFKKLYENLQLPSIRPPPGIPPFPIKKIIDGFGEITINYDVFGFPKFDEFMKNRKILNNVGESVVPKWLGPLKCTSKGDIGNATNWALDNFPDGKVQRTPSLPGKAKKKTIDILDDDGKWVTHTWHHHQNGKDLFVVPTNIHKASGFAHSGGNSLIEGIDKVIGAFPDPIFD